MQLYMYLSPTSCLVTPRPDEEWLPVVCGDEDVWNSLDQTPLLHQERTAGLSGGKAWPVGDLSPLQCQAAECGWEAHVHVHVHCIVVFGAFTLLIIVATNFSDFCEKPHNR